MLLFLAVFRFNGKMFFVVLQSACPSRKRRGKLSQQIRYVNYCEWAFIMMKFQQEDIFNHYNYQEEILIYILALVVNDIKDEILEGSLKEFCEALQINWQSLLEDLLEKVAAKISFLVNLHSVISNNIKIATHHNVS